MQMASIGILSELTSLYRLVQMENAVAAARTEAAAEARAQSAEKGADLRSMRAECDASIRVLRSELDAAHTQRVAQVTQQFQEQMSQLESALGGKRDQLACAQAQLDAVRHEYVQVRTLSVARRAVSLGIRHCIRSFS